VCAQRWWILKDLAAISLDAHSHYCGRRCHAVDLVSVAAAFTDTVINAVSSIFTDWCIVCSHGQKKLLIGHFQI